MTAPTAAPLRRTSDESLRQFRGPMSEWFTELEEWGKRVRRDIINLEEYLKSKYPEFEPGEPPNGGDPGDPPKGPF